VQKSYSLRPGIDGPPAAQPIKHIFAKTPSLKHVFSPVVLISKSRYRHGRDELTPERASRRSSRRSGPHAGARAGADPAPLPAGRRLSRGGGASRRGGGPSKRGGRSRGGGPPGEEAGAEEAGLQERRRVRAPPPAIPLLEQLPSHPLPLHRCSELPPTAPVLRSPSKGSDRRGKAVLMLQRALPASALPLSSLQQ
jgi:hypothetical protein